MKILIISQFFYPDITAPAFRLSESAELLARSGHEVRVITAVPHKAQVTARTRQEPPLPETSVSRCELQPLEGSGLRPYLRHYVSFMKSSIVAAWRLKRTAWRPDVIWASSPPLFAAVTGYAAAKMFRRPWVLDIRDIWPESAVVAGQLREGGSAFRVGKWMEHFFYDHADRLTCVSVPMRNYIGGLTRTPVAVVYNGVRSSDIANGQGVSLPGAGARRILLYAGNLGRLQALDVLIKVVSQLDQSNRLGDWEVHLLGAGVVRDQLVALVQELGLTSRVKFLPPVARVDMAKEVAGAAALFLNLKPDPVLRLTIPSKVFDCLAANKPVLAAVMGEGVEILKRSGGNVVCAPGDPEALRQATEGLIGEYDQLAQRALGNATVVRDSFTREKATCVLLDVLSKAAGEMKN